mgnify:CR=1 FL=1
MRQIAQAANKVDAVSFVEKYKGPRADVVIHFDHKHGVQDFRTEWLKNHRDDFEIIDYQKCENSWMQVKDK